MRRFALALLLVACSSSSNDAPGSGGGSNAGPPLVSALGVSGVSLYQAVKIPLLPGQVAADRPAPVVLGRSALARVFVQPEPGWQPRAVRARLALESSPETAFETTQVVAAPSWEPSPSSTINFELPPEWITPGAALTVSLHEESDATLGEPSSRARFPETGALLLDARSTGKALRVVLVPVQYDADGSGRLPDLGPEQVELYRNALYQIYPAAAVELRTHAPLPWVTPLEPTGEGWSQLLQKLISLRNNERATGQAAEDEYYFGLFVPASSFGAYCSGSPSCDLGLSFVLDAGDEFLRSGIGLGFSGSESAATLAHELGHLHGRLHAPCGTYGGDEDPEFPEPNGGIGTWGYDLTTGQLIDPASDARDFMGYCEPAWISAYNYRALAERMAAVTSAAESSTSGTASRSYRVVSVGADGAMALGPALELPGAAGGRRLRVAILDARGSLRRWQQARFYRYSHASGGIFVIPEPGPSDFGLRLHGRNLRLR